MGLRIRLTGLAIRTACLTLFTFVSSAGAAELRFTWSTADARLGAAADGYSELGMRGAWSSAAPGTPDLPWIPVSVGVARDQLVRSWSFEASGWLTLAEGVSVVPAGDRTYADPSTFGAPVEDPATYGADEPYPAEAVRYTGLQSGDGNVTAGFLICPFRWNPASGLLEMATGGILRYDTGTGDPERFLPGRVRPVPYSTVKSLPSLETASRPGGGDAGIPIHALTELGESAVPSLAGTPVEFLLVTTEEFAPAFEELIEWKNRSGIPAAMRTVDEIYTHYPQGVDRPEQIRLFLRDAYLFWGTRTVVMAGDPADVPVRYAQDYSYNGSNGGTSIVSDLYYACLDGNWNANGNSLFGEPSVSLYQGPQLPPLVINSDSADLRPELRVGRISCASLAEAELYMRKYREYAIHPPQDPYLRDVLILGEVLFEGDWSVGACDECSGCPEEVPCVRDDGAQDGILLAGQLAQHEASSNLEFLEYYERDYWWVGRGRPNALPLNLASVRSAMNSGVNLVFHSGHGDRDRWAIGPDRLESGTVRGLTNGTTGPGWTGLVYSINCNSAQVDYDCLAEAWNFSPQGGGLIYIGSTNLDFPSAARKHQNLTFSQWPGDGSVTPGDAYFFTVDSLAKTIGDIRTSDRFVLFSVAFLGDPDMPVWSDIPQPLTVDYPDEITLGGGATTLVVEESGTPLAGARVALYKNGDALASALTGPDGRVDLEFHPASLGEFSVTVTGPNAIPFQGSGTVVANEDAFVALTSFSIDDTDDEVAGISGNGDGVFDVGETVAIDLAFENVGGGGVAQLEASLILAGSMEDLGVELEILEGSVSLGPLAEDASGFRERAFRLRARNESGATQRQAMLPLEIVWDLDGNTHAEEFVASVYRPELVLYSSNIEELDGNGNGIPEAGEEFHVGLDFLNLGLGSPHGLEARIYATDPGRAAVEPSSIPLVPAGPLGHVVTESEFLFVYYWRHDFIVFMLEIWDVSDPDNEIRLSKRRFDMIPPAAPSGLVAKGFRDRVVLGWSPHPAEDAQGYRVYRADSEEGPYAPVGVGLMPLASASTDSTYFVDEGLPALSSYHYRVAAVDSSGNESVPSDVVVVSTAPANLPGWPVTLYDHNTSAPSIEQLDGGDYEVIVATDVIYAFTADGRDYHDGDGSESTRGPLTVDSDGYKFDCKPAIYDIDGDGRKEILAVSRFRNRGDANRALELTCFDHLGRVKWSRSLGNSIGLSPPAIGDIDGDGDLEVVTLAGRSVWAFHHDGRPFSGAGAIRVLPEGDAFFLYGGVALGNVYDGPEAGADEIVFVTRSVSFTGGKLHVIRANGGAQDIPNFPLVFADYGSTSDNSNSSPAIVDLNPSTEQPALGEIIVTTIRDVWAIDPAGSTERVLWRRPIQQHETVDLNPSPAIGDLDRDGNPEVVIAGGLGRLYVLDAATGAPSPEFTTGGEPYLQLESAFLGSAILGDINGDMYPEILIGSRDGTLHAIDHTGESVPGFPFLNGGEIHSGLAMWDLDKNGTTDLVIQASGILPVTVLEFPGTEFDVVNPDLARYPWTQFRHDTRNTGNTMTFPITPLALQAPTIDVVATRTVRLRWIAEEGFAQFLLERRDVRHEEWELVGSWRPGELSREDGIYSVEDLVPEFASYSYRLTGVEPDGYQVRTPEQSIEVTAAALSFSLGPARPNPSGLVTTLELSLPEASSGRVSVVDPSGRIVRILKEGSFDAGVADLSWDGRDDAGRVIGAGVFFVRAEIELLGTRSTKLIRLR